MALSRAPLDGVVPALRYVTLAARAHPGRGLPGAERPIAVRPLPAARATRRVARRLDDDTVDAARERRRRGQARRPVRAARERRVGRGRALSRGIAHRRPPRLGAGRAPIPGPVRRPRPRERGRPSGDPVGRGLAGGGHRNRPHRSGRRAGGLRARTDPRPPRALARRRGRPLLRRVRLAARPADERGRRPDRRTARREGNPRRGRRLSPPLSALLALRHTAHLARDRRLVDRGRRGPPTAARRQRDRRVDTGVHGQAHGRLAPQHGRLEHLAPAVLRTAAAVLPVRVRTPERDRIAGGARGTGPRRSRAARGAAPALDRRCADPVRGVRRARRADRGGRRRLAGRRDRSLLDAGVAEPRVRGGGVRDRRGEGA